MVVFFQVYFFASFSLTNVSIKFINTFFVYFVKMPNLDPWVKQNNHDYEDTATKTINKFENHLQSIRAQR